jgi:phosphoglycerol transferase MdoB-like AlkP superfamily enzyme
MGHFVDYINASPYFNDTIFVFYGDHDAKLSKSDMEYLFNYDKETGELLPTNDPNYVDYDTFTHELTKNTPLIIWAKNPELRSKINFTVNDVVGTFDIMPTIGNMFGFENKYALGHDVFDKNYERIVIYPNGNFLTNDIYYRNSTNEYKILKENAILDENYIEKHLKYTEDRLDISNAIVLYNLLSEKALEDAKNMEIKND